MDKVILNESFEKIESKEITARILLFVPDLEYHLKTKCNFNDLHQKNWLQNQTMMVENSYQSNANFFVQVLLAFNAFLKTESGNFETVKSQIEQAFENIEQEAAQGALKSKQIIEDQMNRQGMTPSARDYYWKTNGNQLIESSLEPFTDILRKNGVSYTVNPNGIRISRGGAMEFYLNSSKTTDDCLHIREIIGDRPMDSLEHQCLRLLHRILLTQYKTNDKTLEQYLFNLTL